MMSFISYLLTYMRTFYRYLFWNEMILPKRKEEQLEIGD